MLSSTAMDDSVPEQERAAADTALIAHRELCIPKGSRFFTTHKNEACAKTLQSFVREFLEGRDLIRFNFKGEKMQENRLERDVRVAAASEVVKVELAAGSVVYYAIFGPALALVKLVKDMQGVAEIVLLNQALGYNTLKDDGWCAPLLEQALFHLFLRGLPRPTQTHLETQPDAHRNLTIKRAVTASSSSRSSLARNHATPPSTPS
mmetsp:Transcript_32675/g.80192  ORF Transcript_32675/g.80192 Transcript_32675/m.80192 type:complete len:206 (+) Transcript_32675:684-1301(+)